MVGQRTRAALEREKMLTLRAIKELEFDRAMGKLSEADLQEMSGRLRARAAGLMRQLDAGAGYRDQIERDLAKRLASRRRGPAVRRTCQVRRGQLLHAVRHEATKPTRGSARAAGRSCD